MRSVVAKVHFTKNYSNGIESGIVSWCEKQKTKNRKQPIWNLESMSSYTTVPCTLKMLASRYCTAGDWTTIRVFEIEKIFTSWYSCISYCQQIFRYHGAINTKVPEIKISLKTTPFYTRGDCFLTGFLFPHANNTLSLRTHDLFISTVSISVRKSFCDVRHGNYEAFSLYSELCHVSVCKINLSTNVTILSKF